MTYYKCLQSGMLSPYQSFQYKANEWMPRVEMLERCGSGYHVCKDDQIIRWLTAEIWECEIRGEVIEAEDKCVVQEIRLVKKLDTWNERTARLFACDCAERVMPIYRKWYPNDDRCQKAIDVARKFANGEASREELAAAWDAAGDAAGDAARAGAGARAGAAAWDAARDAAGAAAWDAAWDAAGAAAGAAAWDAAWDAAGAAARAGAGATARDAAGDAAWDAEYKWQSERLMQYLKGEL